MRAYYPQAKNALPFRRRRFVSAHRRRSPWLVLLTPFLGAVVTVALVVAVVGWLRTTPSLRLTDVQVTGNHRVSADWVSSLLAPYRGRPVLWLQLEEIEQRLATHLWIESAELHKQLPNRLLVKLVERRPAALLRADDGLYYVERNGQLISAYDPAVGAADLVLVSGRLDTPEHLAEALTVARRLAQLEPEWESGLSEIEIVGEADFRLFASFLPFSILVSADRLEEGVENLRRFAPQIVRRYSEVAAVDLRFSRQIIVQPAVSPRS